MDDRVARVTAALIVAAFVAALICVLLILVGCPDWEIFAGTVAVGLNQFVWSYRDAGRRH